MAARKFLTPVDLALNEIQNAVAQNLGSSSSMTKSGQFCYDTTLGRFVFRGPSGVIDPTNRANHLGSQTASTISDLATTVKAYSLDQFAAPVAAVALGGQRITGLADPTGAQDAATLNWVTGQVQSAAAGIASKVPVRLVATTNIASLSGTPTIDGVATASGDRVLLTGQTTATQNGPWILAAGAWARPTDDGSTAELTPGALWLVLAGTANAGTQWRLSTTGSITPGTTPVTVVQFNAASVFSAGNGLGQVGNAFVVLAQPGVVVSASGVGIDTTVVARKYAALVGDGSSTSISVTHGLGTLDAIIQVYDPASGATVECDTVRTSTSAVTLGFSVAPTSNQYRVLIQA